MITNILKRITLCTLILSASQFAYCSEDLDPGLTQARKEFLLGSFKRPTDQAFSIILNIMKQKPEMIKFEDYFIEEILSLLEKLNPDQKTNIVRKMLNHNDYKRGILYAPSATERQKELNHYLKTRLNGFHLPRLTEEDAYDAWLESEATIMKCNWRLLLMPNGLSQEQQENHDEFLLGFFSLQENMEHTDVDYSSLREYLENYDNSDIEDVLWETYDQIDRVNNGELLPDLQELISHADHKGCQCWMFESWINSSVTLMRKNYHKFFSISTIPEHIRRKKALVGFFDEDRFLDTDLSCHDILYILTITGSEINDEPFSWVRSMLLQFFTQFCYVDGVLIFQALDEFLNVFQESEIVLNNHGIMTYITEFLKNDDVPLTQKQIIIELLRKNKGHKKYYMGMKQKAKHTYRDMLHNIQYPPKTTISALSEIRMSDADLEELMKPEEQKKAKKNKKKKPRVIIPPEPQIVINPPKIIAASTVKIKKVVPSVMIEKPEAPLPSPTRKTQNQQRFEKYLQEAIKCFEKEEYLESIGWYDKLFGLKTMASQRLLYAGNVYKKFMDLDMEHHPHYDDITSALLSSKHFFQDIILEDELVIQNPQNMQNETGDEQLPAYPMDLPRQFSKLFVWLDTGIYQSPSENAKASAASNAHDNSA